MSRMLSLLAINTALLFVPAAAAQDQFSFRGVTFGISPKALDKIVDVRCSKTGTENYICMETDNILKVGDISVRRISYFFNAKDELINIHVEFDRYLHDRIFSALTEKYGKSQYDLISEPTTLAGGKVEQKTSAWKAGVVHINLTTPFTDYRTGVLMYSAPNYLDNAEKEKEARAKKDASGF